MAPTRVDRNKKPYTRPEPRSTDEKWVHDMHGDTLNSAAGGAAGNKTGKRLPSSAVAPSSAASSKIIVSNLHYDITPKDLSAIFGRIGTLTREPMIRYDRSGRSSGTAVVTFETADEATRAKKEYDGIKAKDMPMKIVFDTTPQHSSKRSASTGSLLERIQKPALLERLSKDDTQANRGKAKGNNTTGPVRNSNNRRGGVRRGGGGGSGSGSVENKQKPQTAEDLDKELDLFMTPQQGTAASGTTATTPGAAVAKTADGDVEMA